MRVIIKVKHLLQVKSEWSESPEAKEAATVTLAGKSLRSEERFLVVILFIGLSYKSCDSGF